VGRSRLPLALVALAISLALFVLVRGERRVALSYAVPCAVTLPPGLAPATPLPPDVTVTLSGPWSRLRSLTPEGFGPIRVDFSRPRPGTAAWTVRPESLHLPRDVHVDSVFPSQGTADLRPVAPGSGAEPRSPRPTPLRRRPAGPEAER